jgi:hypothetical protein
MPGLVVFEADVDNSTGTGGTLGMTGIPVSPCPCKTCPGFDIVVMILTRREGTEANTAICHNCAGGTPSASCSRRREGGEWYAIPTAGTYTGASPIGNQGVLRGYLLPLPRGPEDAATQDCYTLPWSHIIVYAWRSLLEEGNPKIFSYQKATENNHANNKWQVSAWNDATFADGDDFGDAAGTLFDINDWVPNGDCNKASIDAADNLTYCEGNFDADQDVDGTDAATFKSDFGRSPFKNPCPRCRN